MRSDSAYEAPKKGSKVSFERVLLDEVALIEERRRLRDRDGEPEAEGAPAAADRAGESEVETVAILAVGSEDATESVAAPDSVQEFEELDDEPSPAPGSVAYDRALLSDLTGLSFSGGGIRSATFNLGVIQGLSKLGLLKKFDYLSTVSGGGYIGSWLTGLIHRASQERPDGIKEVERRLRSDRRDWSATISATDREGPNVHEDPAITFLRRFSNYLTPNVGFFSADAWAVFATYLRNLLLVLATLVSGIAAFLLLPRVVRGVLAVIDENVLQTLLAAVERPDVAMVTALVLATLAVVMVGYNLGASSGEVVEGWAKRKPRFLDQAAVQGLVVLPLLLGAVGGSLWLMDSPIDLGSWWKAVLGTAVAYSGSWALAFFVAWGFTARMAEERPRSVGWQLLILWGLPAGAVAGFMLLGICEFFEAGRESAKLWRTLTWGPPMILAGYVLTASIHVGLVGRRLHDYQREWMSRVGAWLLIFAAAWAALFAVTVYGTPLVYWMTDWVRWALTAGWLGATLAGLMASRGQEGNGKGASPVRAVIGKFAPYIFIVGLLLWLGVGLDRALSIPAATSADPWADFMKTRQSLAEKLGEEEIDPGFAAIVEALEGKTAAAQAAPAPAEGDQPSAFAQLVEAHWDVLEADGKIPLPVLLGALLAVFGLLGWRVDANEFSMHRLYRNRLVRCYLGASLDPEEREQLRQPFTGFNLEDDILLDDLGPVRSDEKDPDRSARRGTYAGPYHLLNTALNLVAGTELAWQERKAASFVFSPLYCGFGIPNLPDGYRRTPGYGSRPKKLTLGTAVAISGAAASPNMGFRTSPILSFLLTVFNVRLGWWLGNPSRDSLSRNFARKPLWRLSGPSFAVKELLAELLGLTREDTPFVYLSDGGHFENLGIYELMKRRCRFIVACDGGADPGLEFDDLGNAIRKCRADLGIEIQISPDQIRLDDDGLSRWHWAVGTIHYSREQKGTLLYLKSSLTGDEPEDLLNYDAEHPEFPHETTGDQWFDESQFESYRRLGEHVALGALEEAVAEASDGDDLNVERLAQLLRERWYPPSKGVAEAFSRHSRKLDAMYQNLRTSEHLAFLSEQFYPEWRSLMTGEPAPDIPLWLPSDGEGAEEQRRHGFYFCNQLIQLMESVYIDLDLETQWAHPDNRGWMNLFKHWSWSGMFLVTWAISASTYGLRFQRFCNRRLGIDTFLEPEVVDLTENRAGSGALTLEEFEQALEGRNELNFLERDIVRGALKREGNRISRVLSFQVVVKSPVDKGPGAGERVRFGCGFALVRGGCIVCFRIQDHLRKMGLARMALRILIGELGVDGQPMSVALAPEHEALFPRDSAVRFRQLFRSVKREVTRQS